MATGNISPGLFMNIAAALADALLLREKCCS
jgi:hypothetical protein